MQKHHGNKDTDNNSSTINKVGSFKTSCRRTLLDVMDLVQVDVLEPPELVHQHPKHLASSVLVWFVRVLLH